MAAIPFPRQDVPAYYPLQECTQAGLETCRKEFDKQEIQLYRDILTEGNEKGVFHIENVNLVADILHYSIKGIEIPYIRGLIGDGVPDEESKRCVEKLVFGALGKME